MRSGTQLDGKVVAVVVWCCVLLLLFAAVVAVGSSCDSAFVDGCSCGGVVGWVVDGCCCGGCWFPVVGCADVLMCCDADALQCGAGCSW